jgi:hypothetical protein
MVKIKIQRIIIRKQLLIYKLSKNFYLYFLSNNKLINKCYDFIFLFKIIHLEA